MSDGGHFGERSDILTPVPDDSLMRLTEIQAMRSITDALGRIGKTVDRQGDHLSKLAEALSDMRVMMAETKQDRELVREIKASVGELTVRVRAIEDLHIEQRGWARMGELLTKGIPWLLGIAGVVYGFIASKH